MYRWFSVNIRCNFSWYTYQFTVMQLFYTIRLIFETILRCNINVDSLWSFSGHFRDIKSPSISRYACHNITLSWSNVHIIHGVLMVWAKNGLSHVCYICKHTPVNLCGLHSWPTDKWQCPCIKIDRALWWYRLTLSLWFIWDIYSPNRTHLDWSLHTLVWYWLIKAIYSFFMSVCIDPRTHVYMCVCMYHYPWHITWYCSEKILRYIISWHITWYCSE